MVELSERMSKVFARMEKIAAYRPEYLDAFDVQGLPEPAPLGEAVSPYIPENLLSKHLNFLDSKTEYRRLKQHTRVTDLDTLCARKNALHHKYNRPIVDMSITGGMRITWAIGRACEKHIRNQFIKSVGPKYVFGVWGDSGDPAFSYTGFMTDAVVATLKGEPVYDELMVDHEVAGIRGKIDMLVLVGNAIVPVEIKSITKTGFEKFFDPRKPAGPIGAHCLQLGSYLKIIADHADKYFKGYAVSTKGILIYCQKEFKFGSPYKEFIVDLEDAHIDTMVDLAFKDAYDVKAYLEHGEMPPRCLCENPGSKKARSCAMVKECFRND